MNMGVDVRTAEYLSREQCLLAHHALKDLVSKPTMQAEFDKLEVKANGDANAYAWLLSLTLRAEVYPHVCDLFGIKQEDYGAGTKLIHESLMKGVDDWEMLQNWLELETLMRNKNNLKQVQYYMEVYQATRKEARTSRLRTVEGNADLDFPLGGSSEEFGQAVADCLAYKGFCMVQMSESTETRQKAAEYVMEEGLEIQEHFAEEFESAYLGRSNMTQVKAIRPDDMEQDGSLKVLSQQVMSTLNAVGLQTEEYLGHASWATTSLLARVSHGMEGITDPLPFKEMNAMEGSPAQAYEQFIRGRNVCVLYMVVNEGGAINFFPRHGSSFAADGRGAFRIPMSNNMMLIFRHDELSYSYQPEGPSMALQSWLLTDIPLAQQNLQVAPLTGVKEPPAGVNAQVMMLSSRMPAQEHGNAAARLWQLFVLGSDACVAWPDSRFEIEGNYDPNVEDFVASFVSYSNHGSFMANDRLAQFDHVLFGISETEAYQMQPAQRQVVEVGYECLYLAGHSRKTLAGENMGVYLGSAGTDWGYFEPEWSMQWHGKSNNKELMSGTHPGVTGARLSHICDLRGPVQTTDTACSSSLMAIQAGHKAMVSNYTMENLSESIGGPHSMLAGGYNMLMTAKGFALVSSYRMLTHRGRCFTFDRTADGYQRGEGTGLMFIKWSGDALDIEERLACLVGTAAGQDGRSASMTAPNGPAQQDIIKRSMRMAGLDAELISICECHGTGTGLGDPIEIGSLVGVMKRKRSFPLVLTTAKANIGHLEGSAGIAGIMKSVLMTMYSCGAPNIHLKNMNPNLVTDGFPTHFQQELCDATFSTTFVGVSSFGFGGTNCRADLHGRCVYGARNTGNLWTKERVERRSLAYAHGLRNTYKGHDKLDKSTVPRLPVSIMGSWDNFQTVTNMKQEEPGRFTYRLTLTDTRQVSFQLCMAEERSLLLHPAVDQASASALICGPGFASKDRTNKWLIDGRDDAAHEGDTYCITFKWQGERSISWESESAQKPPLKLDYYISEASLVPAKTSFPWEDATNQTTQSKMSCLSEDDGLNEGVYESEITINDRGVAYFTILRAGDAEQAIYPDDSGSACGPGKVGKEKQFEVHGESGEKRKVRLRVRKEHISVLVHSDRGVEQSWVSDHIRAYYVTGSFNGWRNVRLHEDRFIKGLYKYNVTVMEDGPVEYLIGADAEWSHELQDLSAIFADVYSEALDSTRDFMGQAGSSWEIILDLNQDDPDRMIYHRPATH